MGILGLFLSVQQLCPGGLLKLAKSLENGEASIKGHQKPAGLREGWDGQLETCTSMSKDKGGEAS